ncbi:ran-binding protein 10 [Maylandia zebra]|uniref:RAN binding protein 10 n=3 Tax=Haplochromini TaxID=319058 RepID=A0A3Q2VBF4_HAPBU|nr:ran-binding protein 10 [Maylandia zebra]XP_005751553.1 PREDICTED: ran-binding protein 10 [Pundamilia nyererei]XP_005935079.1 ran-binding protein 10 isoform X1 [Haplochromis burtoni]XP_006797478.1 ran-binding protein 10 isoform X1 [Neolamprologus brichardi]XP_039891184.1 ran-binding protein 10 [Simochromis diagramma]
MTELGAGSLPLGDPAFNYQEHELNERLKRLYPAVNEEETPLPRSWSPKDKYSYIGLSQNNLRVHYKGHGKNHKDAASVRATHPIPAACGIYYFEVKIVSKGRDGYMGIGLSAQGVNMNRLPGWDKHSYGYHGDDGHSFCSSGTGQPYGPTFTTGDVIGCCVNLINNTCFYTKNGISLGVAFTDLPPNLYPTVGLQTPGEIVDANFGQQPFVFDIEDYMSEWRAKIHGMIARFPIGERLGEWQAVLQNMVSSYLVHHGYCATATAFARATETMIQEDQTSIKNRQRIQKLVLAGRVGEAIEATQQLYPGLLERNPNLLFMLKCRQFVEMVNGTDSEVRCLTIRSPKSQDSYPGSPCLSPHHGASNTHLHTGGSDSPTCSNGVTPPNKSKSHSSSGSIKYPSASSSASSSSSSSPSSINYSESNSSDSTKSQPHSANSTQETSDSEMEIEAEHYTNGVVEGSSARIMNGTYKHEEILQPDDNSIGNGVTDEVCSHSRQLCGGNQAATERMIQFGRELQALNEQLCQEYGKNTTHKKMLQDAFSLLAYSDPWNCPVGQQLDPTQRESLCSALNSAILESQNLPKQPPLMLALGQATECVQLMARVRSGSCSFARVDNFLH